MCFTDSVPLLLFDLSIFSFSFKTVCLQKFIHLFQVIHFIGVQLFVVIFYDPFLFFVVWVVASLSFDFLYLCLVFFVDESSYRFIKFTYLFKEADLSFSDLFYLFFKVFISFIPALIFIVSFLLIALIFSSSYFSCLIKYKISLLILEHSSLLIYTFNAITWCVSTALAASCNFWCYVFT